MTMLPEGHIVRATGKRRIPLPEREKVNPGEIDAARPVELAVLAVRGSTARCLLSGSQKEITLRSGGLWNICPGDVVKVHARKVWICSRHPYISGQVEGSQPDLESFGLTPLRLEDLGRWEPKDHYWGEKGEPLEPWAEPIYKRGPRPEFEMEQVIPGEDPEDPDSDPITEAVDLYHGGAFREAWELLMDLVQADLRCLDAHAHLGNFSFDHRVKAALRHYEVGVKIGDFSLGLAFGGLLPWAAVDNRPFLRCLHGYGLCLWRLGLRDQAAAVFERMLWLNPTDNQGARFLLSDIQAGRDWKPEEKGPF
ncbi:MAG TPA: cytoplasmic protein [Planctomycetota bacterium]|nr:cytoplasmic protein [Planctomycetota bacterium]